MEIRYYLRIIQRGWWLVLATTLVAVNISLIYSYYIATPMYEAVARFIVSPNLQNTDNRDMVNSIEALDKRSIISTYAEVLNSHEVVNRTKELLRQNPGDFDGYITSVVVLPDTNIIRLSVKGPNPEVAALLANNIGQNAIDLVKNLYIIYNIDFLDKALIPNDPYQPRPSQSAGLAFIGGLILGVGLAIFRDQLSDTLDKLSQRNMVDAESQAFKRVYFERRLRQEIVNHPETVLTLGVIHLMGLQEIYDSLPQAFINQILRKVTETLKYQFRGNDIVGRWSQVEFSILLPSTKALAATNKLERIRMELNQPISLEGADQGADIVLDPRIGIADRQGGESINVLVRQAERALESSMESDKKVVKYKVQPFG
ncbi:MAG: diguanylate cyclase [Anaerolineales bacterium]|nr:diguanylate cyclase [Anaerolineales bacterium]